MSRQPFARRYWSTLTGDDMTWRASAVGRGQAGYTFWQRYWASLTMTDLPVTRQSPISASGVRTRTSVDKPHSAPADGRPTADRLDLLDSELRQNETHPVSRERFRVLAPLAAALAVVTVVLGLGLASAHLGEVPGLVPTILRTNPGGVGISDIAFSPDGSILAVGDSSGSVELWNVTGGRLALIDIISSSDGVVNSVAFSPDGRTVAVGDSSGAVELWNVTGGRLALIDIISSSGGVVNSVAFSPDGRTVAAGDSSGKLNLWDIADPAHPSSLEQIVVTDSSVNSVAFSPDTRTLAAGNSDGRIYMWNIADPAKPLPAWSVRSDASVNSVAFSPDGTIVAGGSSDGGITLRNAATGHMLVSYSTGAPVNAIAFSQDGRTLAAGDSAGSVHLLDEHGNLTATYSDGSHSVTSLAFRRSVATLAAGNSAGQIQLFALPNSLPENLVAVAPGLTSTPAIANIEQFANRYFTAINRHNYAQYSALLDPKEAAGTSAATFNSGYASVADSNITLTAVSESKGQVVANLTFTSRQNPADSVDGSACNQWDLSLYLVQQGNGYLITAAPADYRATYTDC